MAYDKPLPQPGTEDAVFWGGCQHHQLRFQKCLGCGLVRWPPNIICPRCYSRETEWITAIGKGKLYTYAVYYQAFHPSFKDSLPYVVAVVELDEGPHLLTNLADCDIEQIRCDMPVEVKWQDFPAGYNLPKFKPVT